MMSIPDLNIIKNLFTDDLKEASTLATSYLHSDLTSITAINHHIVESGGKHIRPLLIFIIAYALNHRTTAHVPLAVVVEFIHTATLLHDDVVDDADLRRGKKTAKSIWGNSMSILVGDFLYTRAFQIIADINHPKIVKILSDTTNTIAKGEVMQLANCHNPDISPDTYFKTIYCKTAALFEGSAQASAILADDNDDSIKLVGDYARQLGLAFQLLDDTLDYDCSTSTCKTPGSDLNEGKVTAPFLYALNQCSAQEAKVLKNALKKGDISNFETICHIIHSNGGLIKTRNKAQTYVDSACAALSSMPNSQYKQALIDLAHFAANRDS